MEKVVSDYSMVLAETKDKFPKVKLVVAGLPPRHHSDEIRTKTKDFNNSMMHWCQANDVHYVENESLFEFRTGEVDVGSYIMTGATPAVHLTRTATIRLLRNIQKSVPEMKLTDMKYSDKSSYSSVVKQSLNPPTGLKEKQRQHKFPPKQNRGHTYQQCDENWSHQGERHIRGCYYCSEKNHSMSQCKFGQKIMCHFCKKTGHKEKFCMVKGRSKNY